MANTVALALALLVALVAHAHGMYSSSGPVKLLDAKGFREMQVRIVCCSLRSGSHGCSLVRSCGSIVTVAF